MTSRLEGKVALVTGGNSGIGRATAQAFAREGAKVVIAARRVPEGEETVGLITNAGGEAIFVKTDVTQAAQVAALIARTVEAFGRLDCAFNNAGVSGAAGAPTAEYPEDKWQQVINVNLTGVWLCIKYELRQMLAQGGGAIVNDSSVTGLRVGRGISAAYAASKHGVVGMTKSVAWEYARSGIRVNAVCPGWIRTPMAEIAMDINPQLEAQIVEQTPSGRLGTPEEVAAAVAWLCSDAASFITGHALVIDGGMIA